MYAIRSYYAALAVASELKARHPGVDILFLGGSGPEGGLALQHGLRFEPLPARGIMGRGVSGLLSSYNFV